MGSYEQMRWSPANSPYAIAVSQSWWAMQAVLRFAADAKAADGPAQQIYARQIFGQLRLLHRCAVMQANELVRLEADPSHQVRLQDEIDLFESAVPGAKSARDIQEHFDDYARGHGRLQREAMNELGIDVFEAAAMFSGGGYDPLSEEITEGPFRQPNACRRRFTTQDVPSTLAVTRGPRRPRLEALRPQPDIAEASRSAGSAVTRRARRRREPEPQASGLTAAAGGGTPCR
jgi:hypothetical protein